MEKVIDNKRYFLYSSLSRELRFWYYSEIYRFVQKLVFEYRGFEEWYNGLFSSDYALEVDRDIIICEDNLTLAGIAIIKNGCEEKKICTLRVAKPFQHQGLEVFASNSSNITDLSTTSCIKASIINLKNY